MRAVILMLIILLELFQQTKVHSFAFTHPGAYSITPGKKLPLVVSSRELMKPFDPRGPHPEQPLRLDAVIGYYRRFSKMHKVTFKEPSAVNNVKEALKAKNVLKLTHEIDYIKRLNAAGSLQFSRFPSLDRNTFLHNATMKACIYAQSAWMNCVDHVLWNKTMAFAATRPPGNHASYNSSMGNCIFNFGMGAANYAIEKYGLKRVGIINLDATYGNGLADLMKSNERIRYTSIHQRNLLPVDRGNEDERGDHENILNLPFDGEKINIRKYLSLLYHQAIPFIKDFQPELVIVCIGYNTLKADPSTPMKFSPYDYGPIAEALKESFPSQLMFGLEGGYEVTSLFQGIRETIRPFIDPYRLSLFEPDAPEYEESYDLWSIPRPKFGKRYF